VERSQCHICRQVEIFVVPVWQETLHKRRDEDSQNLSDNGAVGGGAPPKSSVLNPAESRRQRAPACLPMTANSRREDGQFQRSRLLTVVGASSCGSSCFAFVCPAISGGWASAAPGSATVHRPVGVAMPTGSTGQTLDLIGSLAHYSSRTPRPRRRHRSRRRRCSRHYAGHVGDVQDSAGEVAADDQHRTMPRRS